MPPPQLFTAHYPRVPTPSRGMCGRHRDGQTESRKDPTSLRGPPERRTRTHRRTDTELRNLVKATDRNRTVKLLSSVSARDKIHISFDSSLLVLRASIRNTSPRQRVDHCKNLGERSYVLFQDRCREGQKRGRSTRTGPSVEPTQKDVTGVRAGVAFESYPLDSDHKPSDLRFGPCQPELIRNILPTTPLF